MNEIINKIKCRLCDDIIESKHRHDLVRCKCGAVFTDGGKDYMRRGGDPKNIIDLSTYANPTKRNEEND